MLRLIYVLLFFGCSILSFGQNDQAQYRANLQNSWVKQVPFEALPFSEGSGQVLQVSKNPSNPFESYVAVAHSGVWYSNNNGISFSPISSKEIPLDISAMGVHWQSKSVWVATEQGVFYTQNNGKEWKNTAPLSLRNVTNIVFLSASEVFLSAMGDDASSEKGVFRTSDQGKTWVQTFGQVPVAELWQTPNNPEILYISAWDRDYSVYDRVFAGKKSGIYKSTDKGNTWNLLTGQTSGFLQHNVGRISLAVANQNMVYALVDNRNPFFEKKSSENIFEKLSSEEFLELEDQKLALYLASHTLSERYTPAHLKEIIRSRATTPAGLAKFLGAEPQVVGAEIYLTTDGGASWKKQNQTPMNNVFYNRGYSVGRLAIHPKNEKELYLSGVPLLHSQDGGKNWNLLKDNPLDVEVFQFSADEKQLLYVTNYGFFQSFDSGKTWGSQNLPQSVNVTGFSLGNTPNTLFASIENGGVWRYSDGIWKQIHSENGTLVMDSNGKSYLSKRLGNIWIWENNQWKKSIPPYSKDTQQRFGKVVPLLISPQNPSILYTGSNHLFQSLNQGKQWNSISGNLTNGDKAGNLPYGTISAIAESPFQFGLLYTGSDDGMIYCSQNGGVSWQMVYSSFPQPNSVVCLVASKHQKERIYAVLKNQNQKQVLIFRSENSGKTWESLKANLPNESVNVLLEDDSNEQLLYIGTESGLYVSFDRGEKWHIFQKNLPRVSVNQIVINPETATLYIATQGRGVYSTKITPLKELRAAIRDQVFYPLKETYLVPFSTKWGNKTNAWETLQKPETQFEAFATGNNTINVKIVKDGITLNSFSYKTDYGFNYLPYDLTISEEGRIAHEKQKQKALYKKSADGNYYLPRGIYQLIFEGDLVQEERFLEVK